MSMLVLVLVHLNISLRLSHSTSFADAQVQGAKVQLLEPDHGHVPLDRFPRVSLSQIE
jgi:hypothetical protein